jgi:hypothetical protein
VKALIQKELRENLKFAVPGFLILSALLFDVCYRLSIQPLLSSNVLGIIEVVCNIFGLVLGWFQVFSERNRDLWAFLIHRPLTRTQIFAAKAIAGLTIYFAAMGLPLLVLVVAESRPGQFASPFEWAMVLPLAGSFALGLVWYFGGLLIGLRQARWYASRGLVLIVAMFFSVSAAVKPSNFPGFWQDWVMAVTGVVILGTATWGAFRSGGMDSCQPVWGRRALVLTLALGFTLIGCASADIFAAILNGHRVESTSFQITKDGIIGKVVRKADGSSRILDLSGSPLQDGSTRRNVSLADFDHLVAPSYPLNVDFGDQSEVRALLAPYTLFYSFWTTADRVRWFWTRAGDLAGYDTATRRLVGTIKPDASVEPNARFLRAQGNDATDPDDWDDANSDSAYAPVIATPRHVWRVDLKERKAQVLFTAADDDVIGGAKSIGDEGFLVVTRHLIEMLDMSGKPIWRTTYKSWYPHAMWVRVSRLAGGQKYAVWTGPYWPGNRQNSVEWRTYLRVLLVSSQSGLISETTLRYSAAKPRFANLNLLLSAVLVPPLPLSYFLMGWKMDMLDTVLFLAKTSFCVAALCALAGWWLGRRYHFSKGTQIKWAIFHLLAGLPGFIAFLSVQEWPARETCPHCKKLRVVDRSRCEHCGESFAPAQKDGTEIFEGLTEKIPVEA